MLLSHVTGMSTSGLHLSRESGLDESRAEKYLELISERSVGNPVAYLTGSTEFFGIELAVASGVYLPKPETEMLVEIALELLNVPRNLDMTWGKSDTSLPDSRDWNRQRGNPNRRSPPRPWRSD